MRIVHVTDGYLPRLGGIEVQVHDLATQQRLRGHDVTVVTRSAAAGHQDSLPTVRLDGPRWSVAAAADVLSRADVVHCHTSLVSPLALWAVLAARTAGTPAVVTAHSLPPVSGASGLAVAFGARALGRDVVWTAVSGVAARSVETVVGRFVQVLPNGIDLAAWSPSPRPVGEVLTVVTVMRLCARKRALPLVEILAGIRDRLDPAVGLRAVVIGDGPQRESVQRRVRRHGMQDWVRMTGRLDRTAIAGHLAAAHVFLAPATLESFGIAALEARSVGVPVVAMRAGGVGDFVRDGVEGLLVDSDSEMASAAAGLLASPGTLQRMRGHNVTSTAGLDWDSVLRTCSRVYARAGAPVPALETAALATSVIRAPVGTVGQRVERVLAA